MNKFKFLIVFVVAFNFIFLTGCWDKIEINDRAFIIGIGIDIEDGEFSITCTTPNMSESKGGEESKEQQKNYLKTSKDKTIASALHNMETNMDVNLDFGHAKVLVLGNSVIHDKNKLKEVVDYFDRNTIFSMRINVMTTEMKAVDILKTKIEGKDSIGVYIAKIFANHSDDILRFNTVDLGDLVFQLNASKGSALISKIMFEDKELKLGGGAVIKKYSLDGWLDEEELRSLGWLRGKAKRSEVNFKYNNIDMPYCISNSQSKSNFELKDDTLFINVDIQSEGNIPEYKLDEQKKLFDNKVIKEIGKEIDKKIQEEVKKLTDRMQNEFMQDIAGFQDQLKVNNRKVYLKTKDDWDRYFTEAEININVKTSIRRIGITE